MKMANMYSYNVINDMLQISHLLRALHSMNFFEVDFDFCCCVKCFFTDFTHVTL